MAVCSLLHFLADHSGWVLPTALLCGARTFLGAHLAARDATVWPARSRVECIGGCHDAIVRGSGIRVVATDLDGTLLRSDGSVSERTVRSLAQAEAAGILVVFVTARPIRWVDDLARIVGGHGIVICSNGAIVYAVARRELLRVHPLPLATAHAVVASIRARIPDAVFARESAHGFAREAAYVARDPAPAGSPVGPIETLLDDRTVKLLVRHPSMEAADFRRRVGEAVGSTATATASTSDALVEISAPGVTKARSLAGFCTERGIAAAEVVAIGDMLNDLPMLAWAGTAVAVANAHPDVLVAADRVVPSNDDDGVALLLESL